MEYAERGNLFNFIRKNKNLSENQKVTIFEKVCLAIEYIHSQNIIHRDIKPENILINDDFEIKVCDFGWAVALNANEIRNTFCGTYEYMAPEIYKNKSYDNKVDIWSLGILMYELLHGYSPFKGKAMKEIYSNIIKQRIKFEDWVCHDARVLINEILSQNPKDRPTISEILKSNYLQKVLYPHKQSNNSLDVRLQEQKKVETNSEVKSYSFSRIGLGKQSLLKLKAKIKEQNLFSQNAFVPSLNETSNPGHVLKEIYPGSRKSSQGKSKIVEKINCSENLKQIYGSQDTKSRYFSKFLGAKILSDRCLFPKTRFLKSSNQVQAKTPNTYLSKNTFSNVENVQMFPYLSNYPNFESSCDSRKQVHGFSSQMVQSPQGGLKISRPIFLKKDESKEISYSKNFISQLPCGKSKQSAIGSSFLKKVSKNILEKIENHGDKSYLRSFQAVNGSKVGSNAKFTPIEFKNTLMKNIKENLMTEQKKENVTCIESIACSKGLLNKIMEKQKNSKNLLRSPVLEKKEIWNLVKMSGSFDKKVEKEYFFDFKKKKSIVSSANLKQIS